MIEGFWEMSVLWKWKTSIGNTRHMLMRHRRFKKFLNTILIFCRDISQGSRIQSSCSWCLQSNQSSMELHERTELWTDYHDFLHGRSLRQRRTNELFNGKVILFFLNFDLLFLKSLSSKVLKTQRRLSPLDCCVHIISLFKFDWSICLTMLEWVWWGLPNLSH